MVDKILKGDNSEWEDLNNNGWCRNKADINVYKSPDGICNYQNAIHFKLDYIADENEYFEHGIIFRGSNVFSGNVDGIYPTQKIKSFPFTPKNFIVDVFKDDNGEIKIKDPTQLDEVWSYYDNIKL